MLWIVDYQASWQVIGHEVIHWPVPTIHSAAMWALVGRGQPRQYPLLERGFPQCRAPRCPRGVGPTSVAALDALDEFGDLFVDLATLAH